MLREFLCRIRPDSTRFPEQPESNMSVNQTGRSSIILNIVGESTNTSIPTGSWNIVLLNLSRTFAGYNTKVLMRCLLERLG